MNSRSETEAEAAKVWLQTEAAKRIRQGVKQSEESKTEDTRPKLASIIQVVLSLATKCLASNQRRFSKASTQVKTAPHIIKYPRTHLWSKMILLNNIIIIMWRDTLGIPFNYSKPRIGISATPDCATTKELI